MRPQLAAPNDISRFLDSFCDTTRQLNALGVTVVHVDHLPPTEVAAWDDDGILQLRRTAPLEQQLWAANDLLAMLTHGAHVGQARPVDEQRRLRAVPD